MCGIAGIVRLDARPPDVAVAARMGATLRHRGPDASGLFSEGPVAFAHQRLSIIDLAGGQQPMVTDAAAIVFNGEVYNYVELRDELAGRGHAFETASDTEVILRAWREWGPDCVRRLNGMFAFALYDRARREVLFARDHFGVKPLYLHADGARVLFASEVKALLASGDVRAEAERGALPEYLTFQHVQGERTLFRGVTRVLPGEYQLWDLSAGACRRVRYWDPCFRVDESRDEGSYTEELAALLRDAVRLQMRADVPVGAYLSGGTDSSVVTALASRVASSPLHTFTGRFDEGAAFDESPYALAMAEACGATPHVVTATETSFVDLLPTLAYHMDEPVAGPGLFPQYVVSREAARHVKVVLGGQGGDEIFGGYVRYLVAYFEQAIKGAVYESNDEGEHIVSLASILPNLPALRQYAPMMQHLWRSGLFDAMDRRYFRLIDRTEGSLALYAPELRASWDAEAIFERFREVFHHPETRSYYNKMTHYDLFTSLPALLHVEDRVSMAASIESRVPLLDHRIVDLVARMPPWMKFRGGELKCSLKRATEGLLPDVVAQRKDKMGFPVPLHLWARGRSREFFADLLLSKRCRERGLFDPAEVERLIAGGAAFGRQLWGALSLELWHRTFLDAH